MGDGPRVRLRAAAASDKPRPGPWRWNEQTLVDCDGVTVAETHTCVADWNTSDADRRLIAAAPELLLLVRDLVTWDEARAKGEPPSLLAEYGRALLRRVDGG